MRDKVFISYSRKDKKWLEQLKTWLRQFVREDKISVWDDTKIAPGADWNEEIKRALESTKVAVLLVSQDFLASDFIHADELPPLLKAAQSDDATILWLAVRPCMYKDTVIARYQALNDPSKPLSRLKLPDREQALVQICERIKVAATVIPVQSRSENEAVTGPQAENPSVTDNALKPVPADGASEPALSRRRSKPPLRRPPSDVTVDTVQSVCQPRPRHLTADSETDATGRDREHGNFILEIQKDLSIRAVYGMHAVIGVMALDSLHLELLGIFEDWLHNRQITRRLEMEVFGSLLYQTLFTGDVRRLFEETVQRTSSRPDERVRLLLSFTGNPDLERLPWEFLYQPSHAPFSGFLGTSNRLTLTRYHSKPWMQIGGDFEGPLRILLVVSQPLDLPSILTEPLIAELEHLAARHSLELRVLDRATFERFSHELATYRPYLVHFVAHAKNEETGTGSIALSTEDGRASWIRDREFAEFFRRSDGSPRVLILHKGGSTFGPYLMGTDVNDVVELRYPITNAAALIFYRAFYSAAARGESVDLAVQRARAK